MEKEPLLTIIIPVYNTASFLKRCIESVENQTLDLYEIVIINDGSTDDSDYIIRNYMNKYNNIKYFCLNENIGVGNARNIGIKNTQTKYIAFVDSDDWVDANYYENLLAIMKEYNTDICISSIKTEVDDVYNWKYRYQYPEKLVVDSEPCIHSLTNQYNQCIKISPIVNNKIYKTKLLQENQIMFDAFRKAQDLYFSFLVFIYANKVSFSGETFYHYYQRENSATHNFSTKYIDDYFFVLQSLRIELLNRNLYQLYNNEYQSYVNHYMTKLINNMFRNVQASDDQRKYIIYIIQKATKIIPINKLIEYIDMERIKNFFEIPIK